MCGVQLKDRKRSKDLMLMLSLNEAMDLLAMSNCVHWNGHVERGCHVLRREDDHVFIRKDGHVLSREDGHVWRRALHFYVEGERKKGRSKRTCNKQVEEESVKVGLRKKDALC